MSKIKNELPLSDKKRYNPNNFNATDSGIAYLLFLLGFVSLSYLLSPIFVKLYRENILSYHVILVFDALLSQGLILAIALCYARIRKVNLINGGGTKFEMAKTPKAMCYLLVAGMITIFSIAAEEFVNGVYYFFPLPDVPDIEGNPILILFYAFICVPILPAICEELFFRGIILRGLRQFGDVTAVLLSSLMFALGHGSFQQFYYQFFIGMLCGAGLIVTKSIACSMTIHFANNLFSIFLGLLEESYRINSKVFYLQKAFTLLIGGICLVAAFIYFGKMILNNYKKKILGEKSKDSLTYVYTDKEQINLSVNEETCFTELPLNKKGEEKYYLDKNNSYQKLNGVGNKSIGIFVIVCGIAVALIRVIVAL